MTAMTTMRPMIPLVERIGLMLSSTRRRKAGTSAAESSHGSKPRNTRSASAGSPPAWVMLTACPKIS